jgi:hypothetical protein
VLPGDIDQLTAFAAALWQTTTEDKTTTSVITAQRQRLIPVTASVLGICCWLQNYKAAAEAHCFPGSCSTYFYKRHEVDDYKR